MKVYAFIFLFIISEIAIFAVCIFHLPHSEDCPVMSLINNINSPDSILLSSSGAEGRSNNERDLILSM